MVNVKTKCPVCGEDATASFVVYNIPNFGEAILTSTLCDRCNYKSSDALILKEGNPKRYEVKIDSEEKLNYRIIRSSHCDIYLPELGIEIKSTGFSEGFITNVDGLLLRIEEVIKEKIKNPSNLKKVNKVIEKLELARAGKIQFTIILEDKTGNSAIIKRS